MDDVLTGAHTIEDTIKLRENLNSLIFFSHFKLRKWRSNNMHILKHLEEDSKKRYDKLSNEIIRTRQDHEKKYFSSDNNIL